MHRSTRLLAIALFIIAAYVSAPTIERLGIAALWYCQDRLDVTNYTYVNARAELADPHNVTWIENKTGY